MKNSLKLPILLCTLFAIATLSVSLYSYNQHKNSVFFAQSLEDERAIVEAQSNQLAKIYTPGGISELNNQISFNNQISINTRSDGKEEVLNPAQYWSIVFPEKKYNVLVSSPSNIIVMNPDNQDLYVTIRSTVPGQDFSTSVGVQDAKGYPADRSCDTNPVTFTAGTFTQYTCAAYGLDYYTLHTTNSDYSIIAANPSRLAAETKELLNAFTLTSVDR
jgi:hypothetical protein